MGEHVTLEMLQRYTIGESLGTMAEASYADHMEWARLLAESQDVANPELIIWLVYKDERVGVGSKAHRYHIKEEEWDQFVRHSDEYFESSPMVYIVDGSRFAASI